MELTIEQALQQGIAAHKEGKIQEAEDLYRSILHSQPLHPDANHNLGVLIVSNNTAEAALPLFKTALESNPKIEQFWLSYTGALIKNKQFDTAKAVLDEGKKTRFSREKFYALEEHLKQVIKSASPKRSEGNVGLAINEGQNHSLHKKHKKIQAETNNANFTNPSQSELTNLLGHFKAGRYDDVEKYAIPLTQKFPNHQFSWKVLGAVFRQKGKKYEALSANQKAVEVMPQDAEAHFNLGVILKEIDRLDEAEASYRKAITLKPDFTSALNNLGLILQELGKLEDSKLNLKKAISLKPDFSEAHSNLGITLKKMDRLEKAEASYKKAIALKPDFSEAHNHLGFLLKEMGRLEEAETSLKQAIAIKHNFHEAHNNLGITLKEMDKLEKALASFRQAIAFKYDYADAYNNLGITLTELNRLEEAELNLKQAIALEPNFSGAHYNLSIVHYNIGDKDLALKSAEKANEIDPHSKDFKLLLRVIQSKKYKEESNSLVGQTDDIATFKGLDQNPLILNRIVEEELITYIYAMGSREMDKTIDARFGSGKCSLDFNLFEDNHSVIKILAEDLKTIMMKAVKSDIYIFDSFFNILGAGGGTTPHDHLNELDKDIGLDLGKHKYSLVYYLSVGDQNCSEPGTLKLYDPDQGILPSEGMITIIPASRKHSAIYGGNIDRVMIGVNFYSL